MRIPKLNERTVREIWSIAIYSGNSPIILNPSTIKNPVLKAEDITDIPVEFVADPFIIKVQNEWYMFFEALNKLTNKGCIGLASSSDGLDWKYRKIVIEEPFHMSYPYVFMWKKEYYIIPETSRANSIRLYKAVNMPMDWSYVGDLLEGYFVDTSILEYNVKLWMFTGSTDTDTLRLYYSDHLLGPWKEHPKSPIVSNNVNIARPSGRIIIWNNKIYRFTQDTEPHYGSRVRAFEITKLTTNDYKENEVSIILKGTGNVGDWNADGMHHIDAQELGQNNWLICVDGHRFVERNKYMRKAESLYYDFKSRLLKMKDKYFLFEWIMSITVLV